MSDYYHCTNMSSPVDSVDQAFLNILADYRIGPPQPTPVKSTAAIQADGIFGVYTTQEAISKPQVVKLCGFTAKSLSNTKLGA